MTVNIPKQAAATLWALRNAGETVNALPAHCSPSNETDGQSAQLYYTELSGDSLSGWKIAATSAGGQKHIGVNKPLEGPYLWMHTHGPDAVLSMTGNHMAVAEAEFAFRFATNLNARQEGYTIKQILDAVDSLHPSLEFPDSRISDFALAGASALLADCACGKDWVIGEATSENWRDINLASASTRLIINDVTVTEGTGKDTLGSPLLALQWLVNRLCARGINIEPGQYVTTGVCGLPKPIKAGDRVTADLGKFGLVTATLTE